MTAARLYIITGAMAAGKSTTAEALARRLPRSVHLRGDVFRKMIVNGAAQMGPELSEDGLAQLVLRQRLACDAARRYVEAGFSVVYQDIILGPMLAQVVDGWPISTRWWSCWRRAWMCWRNATDCGRKPAIPQNSSHPYWRKKSVCVRPISGCDSTLQT